MQGTIRHVDIDVGEFSDIYTYLTDPRVNTRGVARAVYKDTASATTKTARINRIVANKAIWQEEVLAIRQLMKETQYKPLPAQVIQPAAPQVKKKRRIKMIDPKRMGAHGKE